MDIERSILTKIVSSGQLETVTGKGILPDHFVDEQCRAMHMHILDHARRFKQPPSMKLLKEQIARNKNLRDFEWHHVQDPLDALCDQFISVIKRRLANDSLLELGSACDDPERSKNIDLEFLEVARQLATIVPSSSVARFSEMESRIREYEERVKEGDTFGIPFGFKSLDEWTGGIQPHEFVVIAAFSGLGKSTMLMKMAFNAYMQGYNPLIISLEMEKKAILRKFDAMAATLTYQDLKHLKLPDKEINDWRATAKRIKANVNDISVIDDIRGCTPDHIFGETIRHKPDMVFVDYIGLMRSARPSARGGAVWQSLSEITQDLKQNARTLGIPIIAAAQTNRGGGKEGAELDNIGGSISIIQDADIVLGLFADDEMKERKEMEVRLRKNRDGRLGQFKAVWDHSKLDYRERTQTDLFSRQQDEKKGPSEAPKDARNPFVKKEIAASKPKTRKKPGAIAA